MDEVYTCGQCRMKSTWEKITSHSCLVAASTFTLNDQNIISLETDVDFTATVQEETEPSEAVEIEIIADGRTDWPHAAVLLLIAECIKLKVELHKKNTIKKQFWQRVTNEMQQHDYRYTWDQVQNKWKSLVRTYKSIKDHNSQTGKNRRHWPYYEKIDNIIGLNPALDPPLVLHNGKVKETRSLPTTSSSSRSRSNTPEPQKRKSSTDISELLQIAIEQNKLQHLEEMQKRRRFNDLEHKTFCY